MAVCSHCGTALSCPDHGVHLVEGVAETCPLNKMGVIWVEVVDENGAPVNAVDVEAAGAALSTSGGFAQSEPVPVGTAYTAKIKAPLPESHKATHALPLAVEQTAIAVQNGQIKLVSFKLRPIVNPVITIAKKVVGVKGAKQAVVLKADKAFSGKGTLTVVSGGDKVKFWKAATALTPTGGKLEFEGLTQSGVTVDVEAIDFSEVDGVELKWELASDSNPVGAAVSDKMTAVKATLDIYDKADAALALDVKQGDGRVVLLQNTEKTHKRAKLTVKCEPTGYVGKLVLSAITANVSLFDAATDGTEKTLPLEVDVGGAAPAPLFVQGKTVSAAKSDSGFKLAIKDVADNVDSAKVTVMDARLDVYLARATPTTEPAVMSAATKKEPGRLLVKQDAKFKRPRGKFVLVKLPKDAPCKIKLKAAGAKVALFPQANEKHIDAEAAVTLPKDVAATDITDDKGLVFWAEGAALTTLMEASFEIDVDGVEDACDKAFFTVVDLCAENGTDPAPRLVPVKNKITDATPVADHKAKIKLVHNLGTPGLAWTYAGAKFTLADATTQTVELTTTATPSDTPEAEELKVVITPTGKPAFPALVHKVGVVEIVFEEDTTYNGGYDKYEVINFRRQNGSAATFDPPEKYDFVSVKKSSDGKVKARWKGAEKEDIFFVPVDASIAKAKKESPDTTSPFSLEIEGQAKDKNETILEGRIESKTGKVVSKLGVVVLKQVDKEAEFFRVSDSTSAGTTLSHATTGAAITSRCELGYGGAIATLTVADGGDIDCNYDTSPTNGKLDMEPGITSTEQTVIIGACVSSKSRVVYVKQLQWSYKFRAGAGAGDTTLPIKAYHSAYLGYIGVGNSYKIADGTNSETVVIQAVNTTTGDVTITAPLTHAYTIAAGAALIWPLGGLSGNPAWLQEGQGESVLMDVVGHELGHELFSFKDVCEVANMMYGVNDRTSLRLRHREIDKLYPGSGGEKQWFTIPGR